MNDLHTSWRVCCRKLLSLHQQTRSYLLPNVMDTSPVDDIIMKRMLVFYVKGLSHSNEYISRFFKNTLVSNSSYSLTNLNIILNRYNIKYIDIFQLNKQCINQIIKDCNTDSDWRCDAVKELLSMREN